jgi:demethylmenaquinone methyltransferase/2-methoxy-6-polyprenyl-1,4-benzoquinol methylase
MYHEAGCRVFGIDLSPAMLKAAQAKLGGRAALHLGEASRIPFADESFDLIVAMFLFHQVSDQLRAPIMGEAKRVMKRDGRFLIVDYHPGPIRFPEGWLSKTVITCMELLAGQEHFGSYRDFMASGGLTPLIVESGLAIHRKKVVGGGTIGLYLLHSDRADSSGTHP